MIIIKETEHKKKRQHPSDYKIKVTYADNDLTIEDIQNTEEFKEIFRKIILEYKYKSKCD